MHTALHLSCTCFLRRISRAEPCGASWPGGPGLSQGFVILLWFKLRLSPVCWSRLGSFWCLNGAPCWKCCALLEMPSHPWRAEPPTVSLDWARHCQQLSDPRAQLFSCWTFVEHKGRATGVSAVILRMPPCSRCSTSKTLHRGLRAESALPCI